MYSNISIFQLSLDRASKRCCLKHNSTAASFLDLTNMNECLTYDSCLKTLSNLLKYFIIFVNRCGLLIVYSTYCY